MAIKLKARKGDLAFTEIRHTSTVMHGGTTQRMAWIAGVVQRTDRDGAVKALTQPPSTGRLTPIGAVQVLPQTQIPGGDAAALYLALTRVTGDDYPEWDTLDAARSDVRKAMAELTRQNPRGKRATKRARSSTRAARRHTKAAGVALLDGRLGTAIAHGAKAIDHATRRRNPPLPAREFGRQRGHLVSTHVLSVDYHNAGSAQRSAYTHEFRPTVEMWALADGSLLLRGPGGRRVWDDFYVRDAE